MQHSNPCAIPTLDQTSEQGSSPSSQNIALQYIHLYITTNRGALDTITVSQCPAQTNIQDHFGRVAGTNDRFISRWFDCLTEQQATQMKEHLKETFIQLNNNQPKPDIENKNKLDFLLEFEVAEREADDYFGCTIMGLAPRN